MPKPKSAEQALRAYDEADNPSGQLAVDLMLKHLASFKAASCQADNKRVFWARVFHCICGFVNADLGPDDVVTMVSMTLDAVQLDRVNPDEKTPDVDLTCSDTQIGLSFARAHIKCLTEALELSTDTAAFWTAFISHLSGQMVASMDSRETARILGEVAFGILTGGAKFDAVRDRVTSGKPH